MEAQEGKEMQPLEEEVSPLLPQEGVSAALEVNNPCASLTCSVSTHLPTPLSRYRTPLINVGGAQSALNARLSSSLMGETLASPLSTQLGAPLPGDC